MNNYIQQVIDEYKNDIQNFFVLCIFDELETHYDYLTLYEQHMADGSIIALDHHDSTANSKRYVLSEEAYLQNEELFYKLRIEARNRTIEKMAKSVIFYVVAQNDDANHSILSNKQLLDEALNKTKRIIRKTTFISDPITWDYFYSWCRAQLTTFVFEEMIITNGVNGLKNLTPTELNELFVERLTSNLTSNREFINKFSRAIDLYIQEWQRKIIHELNNNIQTYLRIEHAVEKQEVARVERENIQITTIPNYIFVLNSVVYHAVREAIYRRSFTQGEPDSWPQYNFIKGKTKGHIRIIPKLENDKNTMNLNEESIIMAHNIVQQLSTIDVDVLDILCSIFLHRSKHPDEIIEIELADILVMRGLKAKLGGEGRRGGFEAKQKEQVITALSNIQSLWLTIEKTVIYKNNQPIQVGVQGRTILFKQKDGKEYRVNKENCSKTISFTLDKVLAKYLTSSQRQVALLPLQALTYHAYRFSCEKQLCRYLSWRWRTQAYKGDFLQLNKISTLLEASGETLNKRSPMRTRERFEKALDQLTADKIIADWHYVNWDEDVALSRGWTKYWLNTSVVIEPSHVVKDHYRSIKKVDKNAVLQEETVMKKNAMLRKIGERLLEIRKEHKLTLLTVAEALEVSASYVSNIERSQAKPSAKLRGKIVKWMEAFD
ncbi:helix-turn-helix domain-containing protein [Solibacillus sp. FSL K6-1523]|uniref:helix-turn-helix domain-containing protein n=1 Tax=Solibacillus sp. FSL K6-1523 TaxID=2921471 RepID=UPI0030F99E7F